MKKSLMLLFLSFFTVIFASSGFADVVINSTNFPDDNFRNYLANTYTHEGGRVYGTYDTDGNGILSDEELKNKKWFFDSMPTYLPFRSLKGIEYFYNLESVNVEGHYILAELDVSKLTKLRSLICNTNDLTKLDITKNINLTELICGGNPIGTLDVSNNTNLTELICNANKLTALDISKNTKLTSLHCGSNRLTKLDVSKNTKLTDLLCYSNQLTELDISKNTSIYKLWCENNHLKKLIIVKI